MCNPDLAVEDTSAFSVKEHDVSHGVSPKKENTTACTRFRGQMLEAEVSTYVIHAMPCSGRSVLITRAQRKGRPAAKTIDHVRTQTCLRPDQIPH